MENNEYADLVASSPELQKTISHPNDEYGQIAADEKIAKTNAIQQSVYVAAQGDADRKAETLKLSKDMNLPPSIVEANLEEIKKQKQVKDFGDYGDIVDKTPGLATWLQDPDNATLAKDDIDNLKGLESLVHGVKSTWASGKSALESGALQEELAMLRFNQLQGKGVPEDDHFRLGSSLASVSGFDRNDSSIRLNQINQRLEELSKDRPDTWGKKALYSAGEMIPQLIGGAGYGAKFALPAAGIAAVAAAPTLMGEALAVPAAASAGMVAGELEYNYKLMTGLAYDQFTKVKDVNGKAIPDESARIAAFATGAVASSLGLVKLDALLKTVPGGSQFLSKFTTEVGEKVLSNPTTYLTALKGFTANYVNSVVHGTGAMVGITASNIAGEEFAKGLSSDQTFQHPTISDVGHQLVETAIDAAGTMSALGAPGTIASARSEIHNANKAKEARDFYTSLGTAAEASKLRERMPEAQKELIQQITKDGPVENIYIPAEALTTYFQGDTGKAERFIQEVGASEALNESQQTGTDIKIPLADWVSKVVGTEHYQGLANDVKFAPEDMTANEVKQMQEQTRTEMKDADSAAKVESDPVDAEKKAASRKAVEDNAFEKIMSLQTYDNKTSRAYAQFIAKRYEARAEARGKGESADQLWNQANVEFNKLDAPEQKTRIQKFVEGAKKLVGLGESEASQGPVEEKTFNQSEVPNAPTFYSKVIQTVEQKMGGSADPAQIKGMLREMKPEEMKWSGIDDFLQGKEKVSKQELLDHLRANQVELKEITKAPTEKPGEVTGYTVHFKWAEDDKPGRIAQTYKTKSEAEAALKDAGKRRGADNKDWEIREQKSAPEIVDDTQYSKYVLPGGENYRELLFQLPAKLGDLNKRFMDWGLEKYGDRLLDFDDKKLKEVEKQFKHEVQLQEENKAYKSSHFDEANILAHTRLNDRVDSEGNKVLFVEEIQSDWHQDGRKKGYKGDAARDARLKELKDKSGQLVAFTVDEQNEMHELERSVPDAPLRKNWHEFVLKRLIREAAEKGYHKIAWTTGEQQADRYDLSKKIDFVEVTHNDDGTINAKAIADRNVVSEQDSLEPKELEGLFGKDLAKKIVDKEGKPASDGTYQYSGKDLKVGGEGMKGFYDKIIPDYLKKFGKKFGAEVGETVLPSESESAGFVWQDDDAGEWFVRDRNTDKIISDSNQGFSTEAEAKDWIQENGYGSEANDVKVHSMTITPEMKRTALKEGFSFFQSADRPMQTEIPMPKEVKSLHVEADLPSVKEARKQFKNEVVGTSVTNEHTGWKIEFGPEGEGKAGTTLASVENRAAYLHAPELLENAVYARFEPDREARDENIKGNHVFYAPFSMNGKDYIVSIKVREFNDGKMFYDKFALEKEKPTDLHEVHLDQTRDPSVGDEPSSTESTLTQEPTAQSESAPSTAIKIDDFLRDVKTLQVKDPYFQGEADLSPRGRIRFKPGIGAAIDIFAGHKDLSTILHETGHLWFDELIEDATTEGVPDALRDDLNKVLKWVGSDLDASHGADAIRAGITVDQHEQMARGFEAYLMEGRAPTPALRKIFAKFKVWFTSIYKHLGNLNVPMDDNIRGVMDRLVAGDEAISRAEQEQNYQPLFLDPIASGMSPEKAQAYNKAIAEARTASEDSIRTKLMAEESRERKALLKTKTNEMREQVRAEAEAMPVYQMLSVLETGKLPGGVELPEGVVSVKLSRESIEQVYGAEYVKENFNNKLFAHDGLPYEMVAEAFGYTDPEAMVQELAHTVPIKDYIESTTQSRIAESYPDLLTDGTISDEAIRAVHNDKRAQMLRMELQHLAEHNLPVLRDAIKQVARRVPTEKETRAQATSIIAGKNYGEMKPYVFQRAEIKAAKEAGQKLAAGDIAGAFEAKKRELLNHELYRAANDATERMESDRQKFKKLFKKDEAIAKTRDVDMVNAARAILAQFGMQSTDKTAEEYLAPIKAYDPDAYESVMALVESATENVGNWKSIKYNDFVAMSDSVQAIWDLAKSSREMHIDGIKMDRDVVIQDLSARLHELMPEGAKAGATEALTGGEKRTMGLLSLKNLVRRVEHWAHAMDQGDINGAFTKYIVRPILDATTEYRLRKDSTIQELAEIVKSLEIKNPSEKIDASEIGYKFTKPELLMALLHTGNESNFRKLLVGRGWGRVVEDGSLDSGRWQEFVQRAQRSGIITKGDMDFVQKIWDLNEKLKPDAQKAHKRMYGYYFNEVTADPVQTPWGMYAGGYMPAIADHNLSVDANIRAGQSVEESPAQMFPTTGRGFTKSRVENYTTPLSLDFNKIPSHLDKVLRFTHIEPAVKDAARLINDKGLRSDLNRYDTDLSNDLLLPWLKRAATQTSTTPGFNRYLDKALNWFRRTSSIQFMVGNVTNAMQNFSGVFPAMTRIEPGNLAGSFKRYMSDRSGTAERIMEASPYMRTRAGLNTQEVMKDINDVVTNPSKYQDFKAASIHYGYALERVTNGLMEMVVWDAAHNEAVTKGMSAKDAVNHADATVRQTQMAGNPEDVARYEASSPFVKLFSMFSGYFNTQANLLTTEMSKASQLGLTTKEGAAKAGMGYALVVAAPAIMTAAISKMMNGKGLDEDDDGSYWDDFADLFLMSQVKMMLAMTPGGTVANTFINQFNGKAFDDKMNLSPAISNIEKAFGAPVSVLKAYHGAGSESKAIKDSLSALGLMTGLPLTPVGKPLGYVSDVKTGQAKPSGPVDFSRGLVTGRAGK